MGCTKQYQSLFSLSFSFSLSLQIIFPFLFINFYFFVFGIHLLYSRMLSGLLLWKIERIIFTHWMCFEGSWPSVGLMWCWLVKTSAFRVWQIKVWSFAGLCRTFLLVAFVFAFFLSRSLCESVWRNSISMPNSKHSLHKTLLLLSSRWASVTLKAQRKYEGMLLTLSYQSDGQRGVQLAPTGPCQRNHHPHAAQS